MTKSDETSSSSERRRGRHIEAARNDIALLDAARDAVAVRGLDASVAAIAERAHIGIGTLYRRFPTKQALLQHLCSASLQQTIDAATLALDDPDSWKSLRSFVETCVEFRSGAFTGLGASIISTSAMADAYVQSARLLERVVVRAQSDGRLRPDVSSLDIRVIIDLFSRRPLDDTTYRRSLAVTLDGLRAASATQLPDKPTTDADYWSRWQRDSSSLQTRDDE